MTGKHDHTRMEKLLLEAARTINSTLDYEVLVQEVLRLVMMAVDCEAALVFRVDHSRTDMKIRYVTADNLDMRQFRRELGQGVLDWVRRYKESVVINQAESDPRVDIEIGEAMGISIRSLISVPLIGKGHMIGVLEAINKTDGEFTTGDADMLIGLNNQFAVALDNAHLYRVMKREALAKDLLYKTGKKLSSSLALDELLREIMEALKQVVDYDAGGIFLLNPEAKEIDELYTHGYNRDTDPHLRMRIGEGLIGHVAESGETIIVPDVSLDKRYFNSRPSTKSEIVVPIQVGSRLVGAFNLESDQLNAFNAQSGALLSAFASQAAISIERARNHSRLIDGQKLEEQLKIARDIQRTFLPKANLSVPGYDVAGRNISSGQVGGDYYDFIPIVEGQTGIAIADVSGKGIPASLIMASFRASLIAEIRNNYSIWTICGKVNRLLCESIQPGNFVTAVYGVLDSRNHVLTFTNCGHNQPLVLHADDSISYLREGGPILGITPEATYEERPIYLRKGDITLLYTDGVTEVFDADGNEFGVDRLIEVLKTNRHKTAEQIQDAIYHTVKAFGAPDFMFDDLTMIVIKRQE